MGEHWQRPGAASNAAKGAKEARRDVRLCKKICDLGKGYWEGKGREGEGSKGAIVRKKGSRGSG